MLDVRIGRRRLTRDGMPRDGVGWYKSNRMEFMNCNIKRFSLRWSVGLVDLLERARNGYPMKSDLFH
jgi:hypothetical protein